MTTPRPDARLGTDLGPYHIEAVIGRGGMGVVYLAEQARLGRKVALKIVSPEFTDDPRSRARFLRESTMAAAIDHPNILPIHEAGEVDGVLFIAMRYVVGEDLAQRLDHGPLASREAVSLLAQVAAALDAAHARGLIHRDVKPANILVAPGAGTDRADHVYLTDFGLTKRGGSESSLTAAGGFAGTLAYIAPEQVEGREVDGRADQYSLACMAFECLTGRVPFERDTDIAVAMAHLKDPPPSAVALRPDLPAGVDPVLARAMAKAPADRYDGCVTFIGELRSALGVGTAPVAAASVPVASTVAQTIPTPRRRGAWLVVGTVAAVVLVALVRLGLGAASSSTSPSPSPTDAAVIVPSAQASPTADVFPSPAEQTLLSLLPPDLARDCERGPYGVVQGDVLRADTGGGPSRAPVASLSCPRTAISGANLILIRDFGDATNLGKSGFTTEGAVSGVAARYRTPGGDCATATRVNGRWQRASVDAGAIVCYTDGSSGDAVLYWSYEDDAILIKAVNEHGDSAALYDYFVQVAPFIAP